jgi:phage/plasmid-like protein (TIGR03299 family)
MAHEVETMAYANAVPWHGLGNQIDPSLSVDEMLVAAGLDWKVKLRPLFAQAEDGSLVKLPLRRALMRDKDNKILSVTGDLWKPFQSKEALEFFREYTEIGGAKLETAGSLKGGKLIWALASIQEGFTINRKDHTKGYVLLVSPHEVGKSISVRTTTVRVVCANTLAMAEQDLVQYKQNHLSKFDVSAAKESIGLAREQVHQAHLNAEALSQLKMSEYDTVRFLASFFQPTPEGVKEKAFIETLLNSPNERSAKLDAVLTSVKSAPGAEEGTGWGILNGITHWADHVAGAKNETRLFNAWLGSTAKLKRDAQTQLLELC